jgi:1-phosphofructokinase
MNERAQAVGLSLSRCKLAVFEPSPALTITIEQSTAGPEIHLHAGGQGFWVAQMAAHLGADVQLCVPLGGETGAVLKPLLAPEGVTLLAVQVAGANGAYIHDRRNAERIEVADSESPPLRRHELDELYGMALTAGLDADLTLLSGPRNIQVLPADTYERLSRDLKRNGRVVLADLSGEPLAAALRGRVELAKVSDEELIEGGLLEGDEMPAVVTAARRLRELGAENVLITRAHRAALALHGDRLLGVSGPRFTALDEHGAGDSMFAGLAVGLGSGLSFEDALRVGTAAGALNVTRHGLGTGHPDEISRVAAQVRVHPLPSDQLPEDGEARAASTAS